VAGSSDCDFFLKSQSTTNAQQAGRQLLSEHVPAVVTHLTPAGRLEADRQLTLAIGLPLRNKEGLTNLLQKIYDPADPAYRHYLTPAQFAEAFGPTKEDYQAVMAFAVSNGLNVT
jgi:subtilase family serine protease